MLEYLHMNENNPYLPNSEILFWRSRFLRDFAVSHEYDPYFLSIPTTQFMSATPHDHISEIREYLALRKKVFKHDAS